MAGKGEMKQRRNVFAFGRARYALVQGVLL